jgi:TRAP-type C4-dicarboxylate transport system permease large subunit
VWLISIFGIHALIGMTIVHSVIAPFAGGLSPAHVSMTLLLGAALGFTVSPVSATILVTSAVAGKNSIDVGFRRQWKYAGVAWIVCSVVLTLTKI